jgi:hypothetical protein
MESNKKKEITKHEVSPLGDRTLFNPTQPSLISQTKLANSVLSYSAVLLRFACEKGICLSNPKNNILHSRSRKSVNYTLNRYSSDFSTKHNHA